MSDKYLVMMRGLVRERGHWGPYLDKLQAYLPDHKILAPNIPGTGDLYQLSSCTSIPETIDYVRDQVHKQIPVGAKIDLCAISLGGMVATAWMQRHPEDFHRVVLINTSYRGLTPAYKRMKLSTFFGLLQTRFVTSIRKREEMIYQLVTNSPLDEELISTWVELAEKHPVSTSNAFRQLWAATKFKPDLKTKPQVPVLLLAGQGDKLCSVEASKAIAKHWDLPLEIHPTGGHELQHDAMDWVFTHLKNWYNQ